MLHLTAGQDYRAAKSQELAQSEGARSFFWPLGPEADRSLSELLVTLRGSDEEGGAFDIPVPMGRTLPCRRAWLSGPVKAAEFTYEELCVANVGTFDYVALCEAFDVLVLTGVPRFSESDENAARRFAGLVD